MKLVLVQFCRELVEVVSWARLDFSSTDVGDLVGATTRVMQESCVCYTFEELRFRIPSQTWCGLIAGCYAPKLAKLDGQPKCIKSYP